MAGRMDLLNFEEINLKLPKVLKKILIHSLTVKRLKMISSIGVPNKGHFRRFLCQNERATTYLWRRLYVHIPE